MKKILTVSLLIIFSLILMFYYYVGIDFWKIGNIISVNDVELYANNNNFKSNYIKSIYYKEISKGRFPKVHIYNKNGYRIKYYECYEKLPDILDDIKNKNHSGAIDTNIKIIDELQKIKGLQNVDLNNKITIFYYYGLWSKILNKRKMLPLIKNVNSDSANFQIILVNIDNVLN